MIAMKARLTPAKFAPGAYKALSQVQQYVDNCGLEQSLIELVKLRASQINGCAWCIDMHTKDARAAGETEQRLYLLSAWREAPFYSARERAALAWTEAVTKVCNGEVSDAVTKVVLGDRDGKVVAEAELVSGAGIHAWVAEMTPSGGDLARQPVEAVAYDADGNELARRSVPWATGDGSMQFPGDPAPAPDMSTTTIGG